MENAPALARFFTEAKRNASGISGNSSSTQLERGARSPVGPDHGDSKPTSIHDVANHFTIEPLLRQKHQGEDSGVSELAGQAKVARAQTRTRWPDSASSGKSQSITI